MQTFVGQARAVQKTHGFDEWGEPLVAMRFPREYNFCSDPFERAREGAKMFYQKCFWTERSARAGAGHRQRIPQTFEEFPPRQKPASFSFDQALQKRSKTGKRWPKLLGSG